MESGLLNQTSKKTKKSDRPKDLSYHHADFQSESIPASPKSPGEMSPIQILPDGDDLDDDERGLVFNYNKVMLDNNSDTEDLKYGNFLTVDDNEMLKYHRELRSHSHIIEKKILSPIVERKVSSPASLSLHSDCPIDKCKEGDIKREKRRQFFTSLVNLAREKKRSSSSDDCASGTSSPNIQKMIQDLLLKDASDDNVFMAIDPVEIEQKISMENSPLFRTRSASFKRSSSLKRFFSPIMTRWFSSSSGRGSSRNTSSLVSDGSEIDVHVMIQSSESNYSKGYAIEELMLSPRSKRIQRQKNMAMRRNSSPELLLFSTKRYRKIHESKIESKNENKSIKLQRKKRSVKTDTKAKIENRQCTPKLRHKNKNMKKANSFDSERGSLRKKCLVKSISMSATEPTSGASSTRRSLSSPRCIRDGDQEGETRKRYVEHVSRRDAMSASNVSRWLQSNEVTSKKSSFHKKKQNSKEADEEIEQLNSPVDPVYSLLKCAADLPRSGGKSPCITHPHSSGQHPPGYVRYPSGGDSSGNTSKTSSPSSSASHSPKTRRKKLNARMKSFSLDTPEPPKQLLGIDESTKKKSSSFTNTCFGGRESPEEKVTAFSASALRKKFAFGKASSLEIEDKKQRSYSPSPKQSPKSHRKERQNVYVALYNFKAKEKDDMDLRAGWRIIVTDSSKKDWWKGKSHGKSGYFPATYVIPMQTDQRVFQVSQPLNLSDGNYSVKFHKDQIVFSIGEEADGVILVKAANNKQALCPTVYLQEL